MLPVDSEFLLLYFSYLTVFIYFILCFIFSKKSVFKINLIVFSLYTLFMIYIFSNKDNFKGGNSLTILFYGGVFIILHVLIYGIFELFKSFKNK